jgi:uncharacterized membrane protein
MTNESPHASHGHGGMGNRGVTRPMPLMGDHDSAEEQDSDGDNAHEADGTHEHGGGHDSMSREDRLAMLREHHRHTLWVYWTLVMLGLWTALAPFTFGYLNEAIWVDPSGGRGAWWSEGTHTALRAMLMTVSDVVTGLLLTFFGWRSLRPNRPISLWICCGLGVWLTFAPILFWAPTAGAYLNDTLVGAFVIALTILVPGMPNMMMYMQMGAPTPPGWTYNPSSWPQRWIMIVTGFAGWIVSRYLAMYQLGYIDWVWDPFFTFTKGTQEVLDSPMSHSLPISDAGLGAISYTFEFLMGFMGSPSRWRTMPWMVTLFGILVIPLGLTHIVLVISQPVVVGAWCTFCLIAAAIMLPMIPLEVDEVVAMGQHLVDAKRRGDRDGSLWWIFWQGGGADDCTPDDRSPPLQDLPEHPWKVFVASIWGMSFPWTLTVSTLLGIGVMCLPAAFGVGIETGAADVAHLGGALIVTFSVICMGEVLRVGRFGNVLLGAIVAASPWLLAGGDTTYAVVNTVLGVAVALLALPRGPKTESYGSWDRFVR